MSSKASGRMSERASDDDDEHDNANDFVWRRASFGPLASGAQTPSCKLLSKRRRRRRRRRADAHLTDTWRARLADSVASRPSALATLASLPLSPASRVELACWLAGESWHPIKFALLSLGDHRLLAAAAAEAASLAAS